MFPLIHYIKLTRTGGLTSSSSLYVDFLRFSIIHYYLYSFVPVLQNLNYIKIFLLWSSKH